MSEMTRWERWAPLGGIVFVVLYVVAIAVGLGPNVDDADTEIVAYFDDSGNRSTDMAVAFLLAVAGLFFLWFLSEFYRRCRQADGGQGVLATLVLAAGLAFIAVLFVANVAVHSASAAAVFTDGFEADANVVRMFDSLGSGLVITAFMVSALLVAAASVVALRTALLPRWLAWVGFPVALLLLASFAFLPMLLFIAWVLVVSVVLIVRPGEVVGSSATD